MSFHLQNKELFEKSLECNNNNKITTTAITITVIIIIMGVFLQRLSM